MARQTSAVSVAMVARVMCFPAYVTRDDLFLDDFALLDLSPLDRLAPDFVFGGDAVLLDGSFVSAHTVSVHMPSA